MATDTLDAPQIRFPLYERQDFETDEQWHAFQHYRNTPAPVRSLERTSAEAYVKRSRLDKWSKELRWKERAAEFDRYVDHAQTTALAHDGAIQETRRAHMRLLGLFSQVLGDELETLLKQQAERRKEGGTYSILKPQEIARGLRDTVVLTRLLMGESTENVAVGGNLANLTDEELSALEKMQEKIANGKEPSILTKGEVSLDTENRK